VTADVTQFALPENAYDLWHDRAVFHFLTDDRDRKLYLENLRRALRPSGHFILATFAEDGPLKCSGLDVERYDLKKMIGTVGRGFELIESLREQHTTPSGKTQSFQFALFERR
jgi:SAM-dependent methyltransferase